MAVISHYNYSNNAGSECNKRIEFVQNNNGTISARVYNLVNNEVQRDSFRLLTEDRIDVDKSICDKIYDYNKKKPISEPKRLSSFTPSQKIAIVQSINIGRHVEVDNAIEMPNMINESCTLITIVDSR